MCSEQRLKLCVMQFMGNVIRQHRCKSCNETGNCFIRTTCQPRRSQDAFLALAETEWLFFCCIEIGTRIERVTLRFVIDVIDVEKRKIVKNGSCNA